MITGYPTPKERTEAGVDYIVKRYRPRIEGAFARIEKWKNKLNGEVHWRTITKTNLHSYYGLADASRITDPKDNTRVFEWLLCKTHDDKGNISVNYFKKEDFTGIPQKSNEKNRINNCTQLYLKKVLYGNKKAWFSGDAIPEEKDFMFKVIYDYGEHDINENIPADIDIEKNHGPVVKIPFHYTAQDLI